MFAMLSGLLCGEEDVVSAPCTALLFLLLSGWLCRKQEVGWECHLSPLLGDITKGLSCLSCEMKERNLCYRHPVKVGAVAATGEFLCPA